MNKLEQIINSKPSFNNYGGLGKVYVKECMLEFGRYLLEQAYQNADLIEVKSFTMGGKCQIANDMGDAYELDKNSITDIIKEYEQTRI